MFRMLLTVDEGRGTGNAAIDPLSSVVGVMMTVVGALRTVMSYLSNSSFRGLMTHDS
jgi:hypothetical protein